MEDSSRRGRVFISCGQGTPSERALGIAIAKLVEQLTPCSAYFAENQHSLEGITENILNALRDSVAFIAIMHPRGLVSDPNRPDESPWTRASVWVEQEIAIAAFISQSLGKKLPVRAYIQKEILLEGLRDKLHVNPMMFGDDEEILQDLREFLPAWGVTQSVPKPTTVSKLEQFRESNQKVTIQPYVPQPSRAFDLFVETVDSDILRMRDPCYSPREILMSRIIEILPPGASGVPIILLNGRVQLVTLPFPPRWEFFPERPQTQSEREIGFPKSASLRDDPQINEIGEKCAVISLI